MTRRTLARLAAGSSVLLKARAQQTPGPASKYASALDGFENKVQMDNFDTLAWSHKLYEAAPLRMTFRAQNRRQAEDWQRKLRSKIVELIGGFPVRRVPLEPQTLEVREFPGYFREKFVFQSRSGSWVLAYLLTPTAGKAPHPTVICMPGHGRGVDDIVGIDPQGQDRTVKVGYQYDYAIQVVEHGMAALAIEPMGFGCRRDPPAKRRNLTASSCQPSAGAALLLGQTMVAWRVFDVMRTIDWIETRKDLNASRIGCMGCSGGGTITVFSAALDARIRAVLVSCYLNTFRESILSISHCIDNYVPGILNWAEMYDVAGLIAPRAFFSEAGERDDIFPVAASRASFERVKKVYDVFDAGAMAEQELFDAPHSFSGKRGLPFLKKHLA